MKKILLLILCLLFLPVVSAVEIVDFYWTNSNDDTLEINYWESAQFEAFVADFRSDFSVRVVLEDIDGDTVNIFFGNYEAGQEEIIRSVYPEQYIRDGSYILRIIASNPFDDIESEELNLIVNRVVDENHAPNIPSNPNPNNNVLEVSVYTALTWVGGDVDGDDVTYDVYINGVIEEGCENLENTICRLDDRLEYNTRYEWFVIASDGRLETRGPTWSFTTIGQDGNHAPNVPSNPNPRNNAVDVPRDITLRWDGGDQDGDDLTYDVYLNNRLACNNMGYTSCFREDLRLDVRYTWYVIASDGALETRGPIWSFTTKERFVPNHAPVVNFVNPRENALVRDIYTITWNANDVDGEIVNTKLYYMKHGFINDFLFFWFDNYRLLAEVEGNSYEWDTTEFGNGAYSLGIVVTDNENAEGEDIVDRFKLFNIREEVNHAPEIISKPVIEVIVNTQYKYDVNAKDVDGDEISYSLVEAPRRMRINSNTGFINWLPQKVGVYEITVRVTDEHGAISSQEFTIRVLSEKEEPKEPEVEFKEVHEFRISNIILNQDREYIQVYVQVRNKGNQEEEITLSAYNMITGDLTFDSFNLEDNDNYWRILYLPKPSIGGEYTIGVWGNSEDYRDMIYRSIVVY